MWQNFKAAFIESYICVYVCVFITFYHIKNTNLNQQLSEFYLCLHSCNHHRSGYRTLPELQKHSPWPLLSVTSLPKNHYFDLYHYISGIIH